MTTITAAQLTDQPTRWLSRRSITAFVAGLVLATGAAVGINAAVSDAGTPAIHAPHFAPVDLSCLVQRGPC